MKTKQALLRIASRQRGRTEGERDISAEFIGFKLEVATALTAADEDRLQARLLQGQNFELEKGREELRLENEKLKVELNEVVNIKDEMRLKLEELQQLNNGLSKEVTTVTHERDELSSRLKKSETREIEVAGLLEQIKDQMLRKAKESAEEQDKVKLSNESIAAERDRLRQKLREAEEERNNVRHQNKQLAKVVHYMKAHAKKSSLERAKLAMRLNAAQARSTGETAEAVNVEQEQTPDGRTIQNNARQKLFSWAFSPSQRRLMDESLTDEASDSSCEDDDKLDT